MSGSLRIDCQRYSRGAIVRLLNGALPVPVKKFSIEKDGKGFFNVSRASGTSNHILERWELLVQGATYVEATGYAIRECERIRDQVDRGTDARPCAA